MVKYNRNKGGRPEVSEARYKGKMISIRVDPICEAKLERLKSQSGKQASEIIRELIMNGWVRERIRRLHLDFMAQLKGIAINLNQLTKAANAIGYAAVEQKLQPIVLEINQFLNRIRNDR